MSESNFLLGWRLRFRYLLYGLITTIVHGCIGGIALSSRKINYVPGWAVMSTQDGITVGLITGGITTAIMVSQSVKVIMNFYDHNRIGTGRFFRVVWRHRDVMHVNTSKAHHYAQAVHWGRYSSVIPSQLLMFGVLLFLLRLFTHQLDLIAIAYIAIP